MKKNLTPFQMALRGFRRNRLAVSGALVLAMLYFAAIFADFLTPYSYRKEDRNYSFCPPSSVRIFDSQGQLVRPFIYGVEMKFDENHRRYYEVRKDKMYPIRFLVPGDSYRWFGLIPASVRLFGVEGPARIYLWGADSRGRDLFSRIIYGGRISLSIGVVGVLISFSIGLMLGGISGYYGGMIDELIMRICEVIMMIPGFYLLLALRAAVPPDFDSRQVYIAIVVILAFIGWAGLARVIRGMCLSLREREFVLAAKAMGMSDLGIIVKHVLPHTFSYSIIAIMMAIPGYILAESALSLIGLGIQDPYASWGNLLSDAMGIIQIRFAPWILLPGFFIFVTVMCFNIIGDALRDILDPRFKMEKNLS